MKPTYSPPLQIDLFQEYALPEKFRGQISALLKACFPDFDYRGRMFYKQSPHYRLVLHDNGMVIGQLAMDYRAMNLNGELIRVLGIIDFAVLPDHQKKGFGKRLLAEAERIARENRHNVDFLFLVTEKPALYKQHGFLATHHTVTWLKINDGQNLGIGTEVIDDCHLMHKSINGKIWQDGKLDMLGYWY